MIKSKVSHHPARLHGLAMALCLAGLASTAQATVVLDTFGPGDTSPGLNWSLYQLSAGTGQNLAVAFSLSAAAKIDNILTSIQGSGSFQLGVMAASGTLPSNTFLYSTTLANPTANSGASGLGWTLGAGNYFLTATADLGSNGTWQGGGTPGSSLWAFTNNGNWFNTGPSDAPSARIEVSAIPEPATYLSLAAGLLMLAALRQRRTRD
ncbi:hypothetical protein HNP55_000631 [Paucibacter oligotrophus]|uniref:Secreted protein with PEP-CTERM sorting signal n=1 Tax=Roseateles oligotrophus TaxID=1769250 RepID=A0A840L2I7_9BURK|nr:PEP-CTERM sorting domain-containing protein [Roseateles oligotrophus]MBB4842136.1 hypothetical protein [Roseateles oligotrophus]